LIKTAKKGAKTAKKILSPAAAEVTFFFYVSIITAHR
jgi:hypothetical protein